jgi:hypothetical protein
VPRLPGAIMKKHAYRIEQTPGGEQQGIADSTSS